MSPKVQQSDLETGNQRFPIHFVTSATAVVSLLTLKCGFSQARREPHLIGETRLWPSASGCLGQDPEKPVLQRLRQITPTVRGFSRTLVPSPQFILCYSACLGNKHFSYKPDTPFLLHSVQGQLGLHGETLFSKETLALILSPLPMIRTQLCEESVITMHCNKTVP